MGRRQAQGYITLSRTRGGNNMANELKEIGLVLHAKNQLARANTKNLYEHLGIKKV